MDTAVHFHYASSQRTPVRTHHHVAPHRKPSRPSCLGGTMRRLGLSGSNEIPQLRNCELSFVLRQRLKEHFQPCLPCAPPAQPLLLGLAGRQQIGGRTVQAGQLVVLLLCIPLAHEPGHPLPQYRPRVRPRTLDYRSSPGCC